MVRFSLGMPSIATLGSISVRIRLFHLIRWLTNNRQRMPALFDWRESLPAILVEGVVNHKLFFEDLVIVFQPKISEALSDRLQARRLRFAIKIGAYVRAMHDPGKKLDGGVFYLVLSDDCLEAALAVVMPEFDSSHIKGYRAFALRHLHDLLRRNEQEFGAGVHKLLNQ